MTQFKRDPLTKHSESNLTVTNNSNIFIPENWASMSAQLKETLVELLLSGPISIAGKETLVSQEEETRQLHLSLLARYVEEQATRNYVLPEDTTAMTTEEKIVSLIKLCKAKWLSRHRNYDYKMSPYFTAISSAKMRETTKI